MSYCTYCGAANVADARFCKACAAEIGVPIINVNVVAPAPAAAPVPPVTLAMAAPTGPALDGHWAAQRGSCRSFYAIGARLG